MSKCKESGIPDFICKTSEFTKPKTLTEGDSEGIDASAKHDDARPQDSNTGQSFKKKIKQDRCAF